MDPRATNQICDSSTTPFLSDLHYYHALARSLHRGLKPTNREEQPENGNNQCRPPLPVELILLIFRYAKIQRPHPSRELSFSWASHTEPAKVAAFSWRTERMPLFVSPPMNRLKLNKISSICLITKSKDQGRWSPGWDHGSHSWFELGIGMSDGQEPSESDVHEWVSVNASQQERPIRPPENDCGQVYLTHKKLGKEQLRWKSHNNAIACKSFKHHVGAEFEAEHTLVTHLGEGDRIVVWLCAKHPGWTCEVKSATVFVWEWFEPTLL